jgi:hypothetical protein
MSATKAQIEKLSPSGQEGSGEPQEFGHPRGTLAIVFIFGALFLLGWLGMYVGLFLKRGAPH